MEEPQRVGDDKVMDDLISWYSLGFRSSGTVSNCKKLGHQCFVWTNVEIKSHHVSIHIRMDWPVL